MAFAIIHQEWKYRNIFKLNLLSELSERGQQFEYKFRLWWVSGSGLRQEGLIIPRVWQNLRPRTMVRTRGRRTDFVRCRPTSNFVRFNPVSFMKQTVLAGPYFANVSFERISVRQPSLSILKEIPSNRNPSGDP